MVNTFFRLGGDQLLIDLYVGNSCIDFFKKWFKMVVFWFTFSNRDIPDSAFNFWAVTTFKFTRQCVITNTAINHS